MKAILLMFDSLNRHMLSPYGCDWVHTPNFQRLAARSVTFDNAYVGSMPCMPARRELHTGRYNFLHRSWGPLEPFDDSMPELLKNNGVHSHLISDHYHYWEEGGGNYHTHYATWENVRGQEGDPWKCHLGEVPIPAEDLNATFRGRGNLTRQDWVNRFYMREEKDHYQTRTFDLGLEFLKTNRREENWFLHLEAFDPHEPYFTYDEYLKLYPDPYRGPHFDWPPYEPTTSAAPELVSHVRAVNAALISMCDRSLGRVLDTMDALDLWKDTMLIVNTDHGFLLGEHDWWGKCVQPFYNEIAHIPLFLWDPRTRCAGERRGSLVQTIDLAPTILDYFGVDIPQDMQGVSLRKTVAADEPVREAGLFGIHGGHVNVTDGRYVYMRAPAHPENAPLFEYTLMPAHMRSAFKPREFQGVTLREPFAFTKGCRTLRIGNCTWWGKPAHSFGTMLFDMAEDPVQIAPRNDPVQERRMTEHLIRLLRENDAPAEQMERLGLGQT